MSLAQLDRRPSSCVPVPGPERPRMVDDIPMTPQRRIRFECFLVVGHLVCCLDAQCRSQAPFEVAREGLRDTRAFADRVERLLYAPEVQEEMHGVDVETAIEAIRSTILLLERSDPQHFAYREGNVGFSGRTDMG